MFRSLNFYLLVFLVAVILIATKPVKADFASDYQGYLLTYDAYRTAHNRYITTRNQYYQYGTLTAQNEAIQAVKQFLVSRDDVLLSYISLLRTKNPDTVYSQLLTEEESFLLAHKDRVSALSSLTDAERAADEVESRHIQFQIIARKLVTSLFITRIEQIQLKFELLSTEAQTLMQSLRSQGKDVSTLERWLLDAKNKKLLSEQKLLDARNQVESLKGNTPEQISTSYNKIQLTVFEANQYMREAIAYLNELAQTVKYGNY